MKETRLVGMTQGGAPPRHDSRTPGAPAPAMGSAGRNAALGALLLLITGGSVAIGTVVGGSLGAAIGLLTRESMVSSAGIPGHSRSVAPAQPIRERWTSGMPVMVVDDLERLMVREERPARSPESTP